jgi:hypothetical protein
VTEAAAITKPIPGPHRLRAWLAVASGLLAAGIEVFLGATWPSRAQSDLLLDGVVGALLSVLVMKWPRLAGVGLLVIATVDFGLVADSNIRWALQLASPFFFVAGALAEAARRSDGHRLFVLRVVSEIVAIPLFALLALVIVFILRFEAMCRPSGAC